jgi:hypothetical protein
VKWSSNFTGQACGAKNSNRFTIEKIFVFKNSSMQYINFLDLQWHQHKKNQNLPEGHAILLWPGSARVK